MMKRSILLVAVLLLTVGIKAQHEVGSLSIRPLVGLNIAYYSENSYEYVSTSPRFGIAAGVEMEYQLHTRIGLSAGIIYSQQGEKAKVTNMWKVTRKKTAKTDYINFPILASIYLVKGLSVKVGVQPAVNVKARLDDGTFQWRITPGISNFDLSIPFGLSYEYSSFVIDARYNLGVTNISSDYDKTWNRVAQITAGYRFDVMKRHKKSASSGN